MFRVLERLLGKSVYNRHGEEIPDPRPAALQIDVEAEMPLHEKILRAVQAPEWRARMQETGQETFEEANDFDVEDELPEFKSIHEDELGDVIAYEEGVRSGFVEEIPAERRSKIKQQQEKYTELKKKQNTPKEEGK